MKNKIVLLYRMVIIVVAALSLYLNFRFLSFEKGILYFTNLSNLLCLVYFLILVILMLTNKLKKNGAYYITKGTVTMGITATFFIYNFVLAGQISDFKDHALECNLVHLVVPILVILDYILFGEKGHLKREYPIIWSFIIIVYQLFVLVYISLGGTFLHGNTYPYYYMDVEKYGMLGVMVNLLVIYVFFVGYGSIVQIIDSKLGKKKN